MVSSNPNWSLSMCTFPLPIVYSLDCVGLEHNRCLFTSEETEEGIRLNVYVGLQENNLEINFLLFPLHSFC